MLLQENSRQEDLWGINIYPDKPIDTWIECYSTINIRPSYGNRSYWIEDSGIQEKVKKIVNALVKGK